MPPLANPNGTPANLRPGGFTDEQRAKSAETRRARANDKIAKYLTALTEGKRIGQAAEVAGLSRRDIYARRKSDPLFAEAEKQAEAAFADTIESVVLESALGGNMPAAFRWLEQFSKERWTPPAKQVEVKQTLELEVGPRIERIQALLARAEERKALNAGAPLDVIDVDVVE